MKWFYNLKIAKKLIISFIVVTIITGIVGAVGIVSINKINDLDTEMYDKHTATMPDIANIGRAYLREQVELRNLYMEKEESKRKEIINRFKEEEKIIEDGIAGFQAGINDPKVQTSFDALTKSLSNFNEYRDNVISLAQANKMDKVYAEIIGSHGTQITNEVRSYIDELMSLKTEIARQAAEDNNVSSRVATITMIIIIAISAFISMILGIFISRIISNPVIKMAEAANKLALGDVNVNVEVNTKDEIGDLGESFRRMIANIREQALAVERIAAGDLTIEVNVRSENDLLGKKLSEMIEKNNEVLTNINNASEQVASGSKQISDSSIAISQGATEQASSVQQLTASLEEISSQTKLNAQNATEASKLAELAKSNAINGNDQMKEMLTAMEDINDASSNISKIIKVIDDIAFQTNILALNAAVEAARAGQHGKGFAVVAEEVRNLAARSANAAKETTYMIENSIKKSESGTKIARNTAEALNEIVNGVEKVANLINEIAVASNEQASGIEQINQGIMQVSHVIQANSATSEESASASEELSSQAMLLKEMVGRFKLKQNTRFYNSMDELDSEVLRVIERMAEKKNKVNFTNELDEETADTSLKIALSDKEFGKY